MEKILELRNEYKVNTHTMIILPKKDALHGICSFVKEVDKEFIVLQKPTDIIKHSCVLYGSNYEGRVHSAKFLTGITYKIPIAVSPSNDIFFFPTIAATRHECIWISYRHVEKVCKAPQNKVEVHFVNCSSNILNVSVSSFENQFYRAAHVQTVFSDCEASQQESRKVDIVYENEIDEDTQEKKGSKRPQVIIRLK